MNRTETLDAARHAVTGRKDDGGKLRYDLEPQDARAGMIGVLTDGAVKYGVRNWEAGMDWSRVYAAAQRHLAAWWAGETHDPDTGRSHLDHAACCIAFLSAYEKRGVGKDDRPAHIAQGSRCVSEAGSEATRMAQDENGAPVHDSESGEYWFRSLCESFDDLIRDMAKAAAKSEAEAGPDEEGWIDHDGSDKCPVTDGDIILNVMTFGGRLIHTDKASNIRWERVKRWRIAEVDGWVRWSGGPKPLFPANSVFRLVFRNGLAQCHWRPDALNWSHSGSSFDIIAYRSA